MGTALLNKKGFTLVEVMVAFVILLFVSLAMMQLGLVSIGSNITNILRDEAVSIADQRLNDLMSEASNAKNWGNPTQDANLQANGPVTENVAGPANPFRRSFKISEIAAKRSVGIGRLRVTTRWRISPVCETTTTKIWFPPNGMSCKRRSNNLSMRGERTMPV